MIVCVTSKFLKFLVIYYIGQDILPNCSFADNKQNLQGLCLNEIWYTERAYRSKHRRRVYVIQSVIWNMI